jgi:hypothetical protein
VHAATRKINKDLHYVANPAVSSPYTQERERGSPVHDCGRVIGQKHLAASVQQHNAGGVGQVRPASSVLLLHFMLHLHRLAWHQGNLYMRAQHGTTRGFVPTPSIGKSTHKSQVRGNVHVMQHVQCPLVVVPDRHKVTQASYAGQATVTAR